MDCHVRNDMTGTSIMLHLATIEEDIDEIGDDDDDDDDDDDPLEYSINNIMDTNDFPLHLQYKTHVKYIKNDINDDIHQINNETSIESTITTAHYQHDFSNHNTSSRSNNTTIVPFIFVTHDKISPQFEYQSSRMETSTMSSINTDNISLKDYFDRTSCPGSPTLPDKHLSSASANATLSPPGIHLVASSTSITSSGKRRGLGLSGVHRASYKRAHTGRLSLDHTPYELFIELQELRQDGNNEYTWHEYARWIRYEEDYDVEMELWQAPRIGCLNFHSLLELRRGLQYGAHIVCIVLLDLEEQKLECIYEAIINDAIANGQMNKDVKDELLRLLTSAHNHPEVRSFRRRSSTIDFPQLATRRSSLAFRKNEQNNIDNNTRRMSLLESKVNGDLNKNFKTLIVQYDNIAESIVTDLHTKTNSSDEFQPNIDDNSNESINQTRRQSLSQAFSFHRQSQSLPKKHRESIPYKSDVMRCIPDNAECAEVLIGSMRNLSRPIMAFVRLSQGQLIDNMTEVPLPVRFLFLLIGPTMDEYLEIGRALSTLFSTLDFRETAYQAMDRRDLLNGVNDFLSDSIVLPPGDFDKELLLPIIETAKLKKMNAKRRSTRARSQNSDRPNDQEHRPSQTSKILLPQISTSSHDKQDEDPFKRSGFVFGGVYREMHRRYHHYKSDFMDAFSLNCLVSLIFMFIACLAPALTFGGIIADKTKNTLGVNEMLIASSVNGFFFGLLSGQPLLILGPTGPFLVFEEMVYDLCQLLQSDFWTVRLCVSLWTTFFIIILVAFEGSFMIRYVTRFTEEIFALIIAVVYLYEPFKKLYMIFHLNPVLSKYNYPLICSCNISSIFNKSSTIKNINSSFNSSSKYSCYDCESPKRYISSTPSLLRINYTTISNDETQLPNKALLSLIILLGTCFIALALKRFRRSNFFGRSTRQTLSDFGMTIALLCMVLFDMRMTKNAGGHSLTQKITVPDSIRPSDRERGNFWLISPLRKQLPFWVYFASSFPAILISVVLFFEVELTSIMIQSKLKCVHTTKPIKGTGYHLDILIAGVLISISGLFGLPWICAAPVRSIAHVASLSKYSKTHAPGEKPRLIDIKDQRLTNIGVHILIGCTIFAAPIIRKIPVAALFGIFLYFGIVSISGTQLFSRLKMMFIPTKYHPNVGYLRRIRQMKRYAYTFIQIAAAGLLITIKVTNFAFLFPFILVLLVPFRKWCLPFIFTERELNELDGDEQQDSIFDDEIDFYGQVHLPI
ncbi:unnamed protein product [Rotaria sp. Silwood2]|nr:unnamed protein product [Rotaria sp. Silwood2]CAF3087634.1 unnamed protein product [Rotaria sp. Silwood2]CAF4139690.1 unnamed protein product [Rotaria sp. Silwood2]